MTKIVLLRHGETEWDRANRLQGHAPVPLTASGREAVETVARELTSAYEFDRLYAAGTLAARETASLVRLAGVAPRARIEAAWQPRDAGIFQGLAYEELAADAGTAPPRSDVDVLASRPRGGEPLGDGRERVLDGWRRLREDAPTDGTVLVVTHDFPIATVLAAIDGADPATELGEYAPGECSLTTVRLTAEEPTISASGIEHGRIVKG